jgi:transcriptional regulator with XRE-family HTH domain
MDIGAQLREAREARGLTIDAISRSTRVQPRILAAIEQNDTLSLPPRPYGRGFVRSYASEVGLDPEFTVREFFSQFAPAAPPPVVRTPDVREPERERSAARGWLWSTALVVAYAAVAALVITAGRWVMQPRGEPGAVGTAGAVLSAASAPVAAPARDSERRPAATPTVVRINLEAQRPVWVTAVVDGDRAVYRTLEPGERVALNGTREISIRAGDAGALLWQVNGRPAVPMGQSGEVRTERVSIEDLSARK